jgi:hypothetical protein
MTSSPAATPLAPERRSFELPDRDVNRRHVSWMYYDKVTEMHLYAEGGHAFGLLTSKLPIAQWPRLVETWLGTIGMISQ